MPAFFPLATDKVDFETLTMRASTAIQALRYAGYDEVCFREIEIGENHALLRFDAFDDFQKGSIHSLRVDQFSFEMVDLADFPAFQSFIASLKTRELRELRFAARTLSLITGNMDKLTSLAGREFAAEIKAAAECRWTQIENLEKAPHTFDEVLF